FPAVEFAFTAGSVSTGFATSVLRSHPARRATSRNIVAGKCRSGRRRGEGEGIRKRFLSIRINSIIRPNLIPIRISQDRPATRPDFLRKKRGFWLVYAPV